VDPLEPSALAVDADGRGRDCKAVGKVRQTDQEAVGTDGSVVGEEVPWGLVLEEAVAMLEDRSSKEVDGYLPHFWKCPSSGSVWECWLRSVSEVRPATMVCSMAGSVEELQSHVCALMAC
jgi:hypothetical protein